MNLNELTAIGPLDGRYRGKLVSLSPFFSEFALIRYRLKVEIEYLIELFKTEVRPLQALSEAEADQLRKLYLDFSEEDALLVKAFENETNHDVKAVEYFIKSKIGKWDFSATLKTHAEFVHFGLTSQDINNTATPLMLKEGMEEVILPSLDEVLALLADFADQWKEIPLLARTHGQAASPTTLGKEFAVFETRLRTQVKELRSQPIPGKFGGATGNLNAHYVAYPDTDWQGFATHFLEKNLGLSRSYPTTQIDHYDGLARIFDNLRRINTIVIDLCQDVWMYVSMDYFKQKIKSGEVGSSAMPHKVNPIDFENAEGNSGLSTALLEFLSRKLPVSRLQRDLTDSTILRNVGLALGYNYLAQISVKKGLSKLLVNRPAIAADLNANYSILAEAIQTILRREGYPKPYEALRDFTRGEQHIDAKVLHDFIDQLKVGEKIKEELKRLRPETYIGNP